MGAIELSSQELELLSDESLVLNADVEFTSCVTLSQGFHLCLQKIRQRWHSCRDKTKGSRISVHEGLILGEVKTQV